MTDGRSASPKAMSISASQQGSLFAFDVFSSY
jgi:hypothetical protein